MSILCHHPQAQLTLTLCTAVTSITSLAHPFYLKVTIFYYKCYSENAQLCVYEHSLTYLTCSGSRKHQNMSARHIMRCWELAVHRCLAKPLIWCELIRHQSECWIRLQWYETCTQYTWNITRVHKAALFADLFQMFWGLQEGFTTEQPTPAYKQTAEKYWRMYVRAHA